MQGAPSRPEDTIPWPRPSRASVGPGLVRAVSSGDAPQPDRSGLRKIREKGSPEYACQTSSSPHPRERMGPWAPREERVRTRHQDGEGCARPRGSLGLPERWRATGQTQISNLPNWGWGSASCFPVWPLPFSTGGMAFKGCTGSPQCAREGPSPFLPDHSLPAQGRTGGYPVTISGLTMGMTVLSPGPAHLGEMPVFL